MSYPLRLALFLAFAAAWIAGSWWSWRTVRRRAAVRVPVIARFGMSPWGGIMLISMAVQQTLEHVEASLGEAVGMAAFWEYLPLGLLIAFPICVWGDYVFNRTLLALLERVFPPPTPRS